MGICIVLELFQSTLAGSGFSLVHINTLILPCNKFRSPHVEPEPGLRRTAERRVNG